MKPHFGPKRLEVKSIPPVFSVCFSQSKRGVSVENSTAKRCKSAGKPPFFELQPFQTKMFPTRFVLQVPKHLGKFHKHLGAVTKTSCACHLFCAFSSCPPPSPKSRGGMLDIKLRNCHRHLPISKPPVASAVHNSTVQ